MVITAMDIVAIPLQWLDWHATFHEWRFGISELNLIRVLLDISLLWSIYSANRRGWWGLLVTISTLNICIYVNSIDPMAAWYVETGPGSVVHPLLDNYVLRPAGGVLRTIGLLLMWVLLGYGITQLARRWRASWHRH